MEQVTSPRHTYLYIVLGLLIILAILYFGLRPRSPGQDVSDNTDAKYGQVTLTAEERAAKQASLNEARLAGSVQLSPDEAAAKKKLLEDPRLTQTVK